MKNHSKKEGLVGIDIEAAQRSKSLDLLQISGINTGNLLFTHAIATHLIQPHCVGFSFESSIELINQDFNSLVIPAANWIYILNDFGFLADSLEKIHIPICCLGLGSQNTLEELVHLPEGTLNFLKTLSSKSKLIGVRGRQTQKILEYYGIINTEVIGCPSIFPNFKPKTKLDFFSWDLDPRLSLSFTRYSKCDLGPNCPQKRLAELSAQFASSIVLQSEEAEIRYLESPDAETAAWLCSYYNIDESELPGLLSKMQFFNSQESWVQFHRKNTDFTISSRIHGCIASLLAGKPALLLLHDQRTLELAESMGIPQRPIDCVHNIQTKEDLLDLIRDLDYTEFFAKQITNLEKLKRLYKTCGVATSI